MSLTIYLAGPDVFEPDAERIANLKKDLCEQHGFIGLDPLDNKLDFTGMTKWQRATAIEEWNVRLMRRSDAIVANLTPFRGPSADVGTASEVGFMRAYQRLLLGYAVVNSGQDVYHRRVLPCFANKEGWVDENGRMVEDFGLFDNLMISAPLMHMAVRLKFDPDSWVEAFEECLLVLKGYAAAKGL